MRQAGQLWQRMQLRKSSPNKAFMTETESDSGSLKNGITAVQARVLRHGCMKLQRRQG